MNAFGKRLGLLLVFWIAAAAAEQSLRVAVPEVPASLDPHRAATPVARALSREVFEGLVTFDANGRPAPGLAESWTVESGGTRYLFTLRPGLKWSDGRPLTAADVIDGLKRVLDPAAGAPLSAMFLPIRNAAEFQLGTLTSGQSLGVVARSDRLIEISLAAPSARLLHTLASPSAAPVPRHKVAALGEAWAAPFLVVGNGAFVPTPAGDGYALKRNGNYSGAVAPTLERVSFVVVPSFEAAVAAVAEDRADLAMGFEPEPRLRSQQPARSSVMRAEASPVTYMWTANTRRPLLDQRDVRHALAMMLDREALIESLGLEEVGPAFSMTPPGLVRGYNPPLAPYGKLQQPEREIIAEVLLLDTKRTALPTLRLSVPEGRVPAALADAAARSWRALGFKVEVLTPSAADHVAALLGGDFDIAAAMTIDRDADAWPTLFAFSRAAGPLNVTGYGEVAFEERLVPADGEQNPDYRLGNLRSAEDVLAEDQVAWPLFTFTPAAPVSTNVLGWQPNHTGLHPLRYLSLK